MKVPLRKQLRSARRALSHAEHRLHSNAPRAPSRSCRHSPPAKESRVYLPFDRETDTASLIVAARRRGLRIYVPVIVDKRHARIRFYPLGAKTRVGTFGISVPHRRGTPVSARWLNLIVVPLVGVDGQGRRLGMGGGYYDRALQFRRLRRVWPGPHLVGLAFECQRTDASFAQEWDVRLNSLATESGVRRFL